MFDIDWPKEMLGDPTQHELAEGPFVVEHFEDRFMGAHLEYNGDDLGVFDGSISHWFDKTYAVEVIDNVVIFTSLHYDSVFEFRPITLEDAEWFAPGEEFVSLDDLKEEVLGQLDAAYKY